MQKLVKCQKPTNLDDKCVGTATLVNGHTFLGRYDTDGNYYEHDETADVWYRFTSTDFDVEREAQGE